MGVEQKVVITAQTLDGTTVKFDKDTMVSMARVISLDGDKVYIDPETATEQETSFIVTFDDILEGATPKRLSWHMNDLPEEARKIVTVGFFDGTKKVFSNAREAARYLKTIGATVTNIAEYAPTGAP
jgi:hypothetical protein